MFSNNGSRKSLNLRVVLIHVRVLYYCLFLQQEWGDLHSVYMSLLVVLHTYSVTLVLLMTGIGDWSELTLCVISCIVLIHNQPAVERYHNN